eukprot:snap_masked-scaffold_52-processed-gene-0.30-mRNA-1 protein AED:0.08 eAED:1.00 QI:0/-1/0/1/-1/1/1/0/318
MSSTYFSYHTAREEPKSPDFDLLGINTPSTSYQHSSNPPFVLPLEKNQPQERIQNFSSSISTYTTSSNFTFSTQKTQKFQNLSPDQLRLREIKKNNLKIAKNLHLQGLIGENDKHQVKSLILKNHPLITISLQTAISGNPAQLNGLLNPENKENRRKNENGNKKTIREEDDMPATLHFVKKEGKSYFVGHLFLRVSSKKWFRKWKLVFFSLDEDKLNIYASYYSWKHGAAPIKCVYFSRNMTVSKPMMKVSQSAMDVPMKGQLYYVDVSDNTNGGEKQSNEYSDFNESKKLLRIASLDRGEIDMVSKGIERMIQEKKK